ncbi:UTRA domain-containing protein, partial [Rhizobium leguminosarum]|uniref:UTRA domain-containing protein n=1 Tax=Rhizobium leguminosarum TaxID=384 RepID=UPI003F9DB8E8
ALFELRNIAEEIAERGHFHDASVFVLAQETASPEVADSLELPIGAAFFHSLIVHSENGVPVQIEDRFVHPEVALEYLAQGFSTRTPNVDWTAVAP